MNGNITCFNIFFKLLSSHFHFQEKPFILGETLYHHYNCLIHGVEEDRTPDLRIANATLSQLSYDPYFRSDIITSLFTLLSGLVQ